MSAVLNGLALARLPTPLRDLLGLPQPSLPGARHHQSHWGRLVKRGRESVESGGVESNAEARSARDRQAALGIDVKGQAKQGVSILGHLGRRLPGKGEPGRGAGTQTAPGRHRVQMSGQLESVTIGHGAKAEIVVEGSPHRGLEAAQTGKAHGRREHVVAAEAGQDAKPSSAHGKVTSAERKRGQGAQTLQSLNIFFVQGFLHPPVAETRGGVHESPGPLEGPPRDLANEGHPPALVSVDVEVRIRVHGGAHRPKKIEIGRLFLVADTEHHALKAHPKRPLDGLDAGRPMAHLLVGSHRLDPLRKRPQHRSRGRLGGLFGALALGQALGQEGVDGETSRLSRHVPKGDIHPVVSPSEVGGFAEPFPHRVQIVGIQPDQKRADELAQPLPFPAEGWAGGAADETLLRAKHEEGGGKLRHRVSGDPGRKERRRKGDFDVVKLDPLDTIAGPRPFVTHCAKPAQTLRHRFRRGQDWLRHPQIDGWVDAVNRPPVTPFPTPIAAVILAAGQGTRMKSARAKVLFEVGGEPMIVWPVRCAVAVGAAPVVVVVGHQAEAVEAAVEARFPGQTRAALQAERLGTGHAARIGLEAIPDFEGVVLILYGDVPLLEAASLRALAAQVEAHRPVAVMTTRLSDPSGYGRILRDEAENLTRIVEHKDASSAERAVNEVNAGIYAVRGDFLREALAALRSDNAQGEYYLTDIVDLARERGLEVAGHLVDPEEVQGANDRRQLAQLERLARRRAVERHLAAGVTFLDPETAWVGPEVEIGVDAVIHAGVHLRGATRIGSGCVIEVGAILTDAVVEAEARVHPYSVIEGGVMGPGSQLGPFGRLRPEARLGARARVGNFVEVKKAVLGEGAKANHLAYIGDATVGAGANVGAGTITCNYDGFGKYRTEIGEGVFVGSNSTLVAPVSIGAGAYVGAGSVLTEPVPEDALALGRARQVVKAERAPALRAAAQARKLAKKE